MLGSPIEEVHNFNYLGTQHNYNGTWGPAIERAVQQAKKATFLLERKFVKWEFRVHEKIELFNKLVLPVALYGSELWGCTNISIVSKFQLEFLKKHLHLRPSTPGYMVILESGCLPVVVDAKCRTINYWSKLVDTNLPKKLATKVYKLLKTEDLGWVKLVKTCLYDEGYLSVWDSNVVTKRIRFMSDFKRSCTLNCLIKVFQDCFDSSKGELYTLLAASLSAREPAWHIRRLNYNHWLPIETGRWDGTPRSERLCNNCDRGTVGDEYHVVFECSLFNDQREPLVDDLERYEHMPRLVAMATLLDCKHRPTLHRLAKFLVKVDKTISENYRSNRPP